MSDEPERPSSAEWRCLRESALERDNHRCVNCSSTKKLEVHHIVPVEVGGTNRVSNLCTLCSSCHRSIHSGETGDGQPIRKRREDPWTPTIEEVRRLLNSSQHPLDRALLIVGAKTGMGVGEICNLKLSDINLCDSSIESCFVAPKSTLPNYPSILIRIPESRTETGGRRERQMDTVVPLDRESELCLRKWLATRPDTPSHSRLFASTSEWGCPLTRGMLENRFNLCRKRADLPKQFSPITLRHFFEEEFPGHREYCSYILGRTSNQPDLDELQTEYLEHSFDLLQM